MRCPLSAIKGSRRALSDRIIGLYCQVVRHNECDTAAPSRRGRIFEKIQSTLMLAKVITFAHLSAALAISAPN